MTLTKSADQGNAAAQNSLGFCYANGRGVCNGSNKTKECYTKAAAQGQMHEMR
ncbi:sel1 repeat family protein [archaeon]|nr:MAG: sel1 repeat family protein [archaeon]